MAIPVTQKQAEPIFFNVLTSVQHTSTIFDIIKKKIPILLTNLRNDILLQQRFVDTVKALIEHFNTFPGHQDYSDLVSHLLFNSWRYFFLIFHIFTVTCAGECYIKQLFGINQLQTTIGNSTVA